MTRAVFALVIGLAGSAAAQGVDVPAAQEVDGQTGVGEVQEAARRWALSGSFQALPLVLKVGQEVRVTGETGRAIRGKVVSISNDQLVVARLQNPFGFLRPREKRVFAKELVRTISNVDSGWNGGLIGAAAGAGLLAALIRIECSPACDDNFGRRGRWEVGKFLFIPVGLSIGWGLDEKINQPIYERQLQKPRVTIAPWLRRDAKGVTAQVHF